MRGTGITVPWGGGRHITSWWVPCRLQGTGPVSCNAGSAAWGRGHASWSPASLFSRLLSHPTEAAQRPMLQGQWGRVDGGWAGAGAGRVKVCLSGTQAPPLHPSMSPHLSKFEEALGTSSEDSGSPLAGMLSGAGSQGSVLAASHSLFSPLFLRPQTLPAGPVCFRKLWKEAMNEAVC